MTNGTEVERKFLVADTSIISGKKTIIKQGYLVIASNGEEVRVRNRSGRYTLTYKSGGTLERTEHETELTAEQFDKLWPATEGKRVEKERYEYRENNLVYEIDVYKNDLIDLSSTVEVEFSSAAQADAFTPPKWFGKDVTNDARYKNQSLAVYGVPEK